MWDLIVLVPGHCRFMVLNLCIYSFIDKNINNYWSVHLILSSRHLKIDHSRKIKQSPLSEVELAVVKFLRPFVKYNA